MSARDQAIEAMADAIERQEDEWSGSPAHQLALVALDAVPPRVLAQLAINTGALEPSTLDQTGTLYRLTTGETTGNDLNMVWGLRWQQQFDRAERAEARIAELEGGSGGS